MRSTDFPFFIITIQGFGGADIIGYLMNEMTERKGQLVVVFAGYKDNINDPPNTSCDNDRKEGDRNRLCWIRTQAEEHSTLANKLQSIAKRMIAGEREI